MFVSRHNLRPSNGLAPRLASLCLGLASLCLGLAPGAPAQTPPEAGAAPAARSWETEGKLSLADKIAMVNDKLAGNPLDGRSWNELGVLQTEQGDFAAARDAFVNAVQCDRQNGEFHRNLGLVFTRLDNAEMALFEFNEYRRLDQFGGKDIWRLIGGAQRQAGQPAEARKTYQEGIDELGTPPTAESFRLVTAMLELETAAGNDQAVHDLLEAWAPRAVAFRDSLGDPGADGGREAVSIVQQCVGGMIEDAGVMESSGLDAEALAMYDRAFTLDPTRPDLLPRMVEIQLRLGQVAEAEATAERARVELPDEAATWLASAKVHEAGGRVEEALIDYRKAWAKAQAAGGQVEGLRLTIGTLLLRLDRNDEAANWLRAGLAADATPDYLYCYGFSLLRLSRAAEAVPHLRKAVAAQPDMAKAWQVLAQSLQATDQYAAAGEAYRKLFELQPDKATALLAGSMAHKAKQTDRAVESYLKALELDPDYDKAWNNLALCYLEAKRYEEAVPAFTRLVELEGPTYKNHYNVGLCCYFLGRYDEAMTAFKSALAIEKTVNVLNGIGLVWDKKGNKTEATSWYAAAKEYDAQLKKPK